MKRIEYLELNGDRLSVRQQSYCLYLGNMALRLLAWMGVVLMLVSMPWLQAYAAGTAAQGSLNFNPACSGCHGAPNPAGTWSTATVGYSPNAHPLSWYADDLTGSRIAGAASPGYTITGNATYATTSSMAAYSATLGTAAAPLQYSVDIAYYFASLFAAPGQPTAVNATRGNAQATVTFSAPTSALTITGYTVTSNPAGGVDSNAGTAGLSHVITGLTNGTAYTFTVTATSNAGTGAASVASNSITPATVPNAPTIGTATAGNAQATVTFTAPANNGGSAITGYTVTSNPAGGVDSNAGTTGLSHVVTGLTNGTAYTFTVVANNVVGSSAASAATTPAVIPMTVPNAPTIGTATAGNAQATVTFTAPANNGGSLVTGYTVTSNPAGGIDSNAGTTGLSHVVTGLTNGTAYTFTVVASNIMGAGAASAASNSITPATVPNAPTIGTATAGNAQATVTFTAPANNGGSAVTGYTVTSNPAGGIDSNAGTTGLSHVVTGLTNGTAYTFTVVASNIVGAGAASASSNAVTPVTIPGAPTGVTALSGNAQVTVSFLAPAVTGGSAITGYNVTSIPAGGIDTNAGTTSLSHVVTGLSNGTAYQFTVTATSTAGVGSPSSPSPSVVPATVPNAPTIGAATSGNAQATVTFTAPANNGGSAITGYTVTSNPAGGVDSNAGTTGLSHVVTGLTNGTAYTFTVVASNIVGAGAASASTNAVTPATVPNAPTIGTATAGNAQATVTFTAPANNGGSAITGYTVTSNPAGGIDSNAGTTGLSHVVTGLTNGTAYTFTVVASNIVGAGAASASTNVVTPVTVPGAPAINSVVAGNAQAIVNITAPASNGGAVITGYTVISNPAGGIDSAANSTALSHVITGLTNHVAYTFTVVASNIVGAGAASVASATVTPEAPPSATASSTTVAYGSASNIITPVISGTVNVAGLVITIAPAHGVATTSTINNTITYTPTANYYGPDSLTYTVTGPGGTSLPAIISITVGNPPPPKVTNATMTTTLNTTQILDLAPFISGVGVTGINISTQPSNGTVTVSGTTVSYTPNKDFFGSDSFVYLAYGVAGQVSSNSGIVSVTIIGRPDPTKDLRVTGLIKAQTDALRRFSTSQQSNFQLRLESLHHQMTTPVLGDSTDEFSPPASLGSAPAPADGSGFNRFNSWESHTALGHGGAPNTLLSQDKLNDGRIAAPNPMASLMFGLATNLASNSTLNLTTISNAVAKQDDGFSRLDFWAAGNLRFGSGSQNATTTQFTTDGVTLGVDKRMDRQLTVGAGIGYAIDNSSIGTDGTSNKATGNSAAAYASYQFDSGRFIDAMFGYGKIKFDTNRYVPAVNSFARASRNGDQLFGSVSFGYEHYENAFMWSPYGRYDFSFDRLNATAETGAGANALRYSAENLHSSTLAFGARAQSAHQTDYGVIQPRARLEYQRGIQRIGGTSLAYADLLGTQYAMTGTSQNTHSFVAGVGSDVVLNDTLKLALDYQKMGSNGAESYQMVNFRLTKTLSGKNDFASLFEESYASTISKPTGLIVAASYTYDDNVSRSSEAADRLSDTIYNFTANKSYATVLAKQHRLSLNYFLDTEMFKTYSGLDRLSGGAQGEYAFRTSGDFGAPTYGIFARLTQDKFNSALRDGTRSSFGVNLRKSLSDRINLFTVLANNTRTGRSDVFNTKDQSARLNLDYFLATDNTIYLTGEYKKGDFVSSGLPSLKILDVSVVRIQDDVFGTKGYSDYRVRGKTVSFNLGYNLGFGPKDSADFSWRRVQSTPELRSPAGTINYVVNQFTISYLLAF